jgi:hypothetical protein
LNHAQVTPEALFDGLFKLFCFYGDVQRITIFSEQKSALIQMNDDRQAAVARMYLDQVRKKKRHQFTSEVEIQNQVVVCPWRQLILAP